MIKKIMLTIFTLAAIGAILLPIYSNVLRGKSDAIVKYLWEKKGTLDADKAKYEYAVRNLQKAIRLNPFNEDAYLSLSSAYLLANENEEAIKTAQKALKLKKRYVLYSILGTAYFKNGEYFLAKKALDRSLSYNPEFKDAQNVYNELTYRTKFQEKE